MAYSELRVGEFVAALAERTPAPASGAAAALTGAFAAADAAEWLPVWPERRFDFAIRHADQTGRALDLADLRQHG